MAELTRKQKVNALKAYHQQSEAIFEAWKNSSEYAAIQKFIDERNKIDRIEMSVNDITKNI